jgi:hypothetical protein
LVKVAASGSRYKRTGTRSVASEYSLGWHALCSDARASAARQC